MLKMNKKANELLNKLIKHQTLKDEKIFTKAQLNKLIELVACAYIYNVDMHIGTPQEQRLLKNIYCILTGNDDPESER